MGHAIIHPNIYANCFIESGTFYGTSIATALASGRFEEFYSVDVDGLLVNTAERKFAQNDNVHLYHGTSPDIFRMILPSLSEKNILFWLDGHYQGYSETERDSKYGECPVLEELKVIKELAPNAIILIDDAFMFFDEFWNDSMAWPQNVKFKRNEWPTYDEIVFSLRESHETTLENNIIYCYPKAKWSMW